MQKDILKKLKKEKKNEDWWYAVINKDATSIWGYGLTKKEANKYANKLYKDCSFFDNIKVKDKEFELYKTVIVSIDVIEYIENIEDNLLDCLFIYLIPSYLGTGKPQKALALTRIAKEKLDAFRNNLLERKLFKQEFESL